jgi:hypothetical protein
VRFQRKKKQQASETGQSAILWIAISDRDREGKKVKMKDCERPEKESPLPSRRTVSVSYRSMDRWMGSTRRQNAIELCKEQQGGLDLFSSNSQGTGHQ